MNLYEKIRNNKGKSKNGNINKSKSVIYILIFMIIIVVVSFLSINYILNNKDTVILTQLQPNSKSQMMGYTIKTKNDKFVVIDGGTKADSENLMKHIEQNGGKIDYWILTHPHNDHVGAFSELIDSGKVQADNISNILVTLNDVSMVEEYENSRLNDIKTLTNTLSRDDLKSKIKEVSIGEEFIVDNMRVEIIGVKNPDITTNFGNNSSMIFKLHIGRENVLFLGDTGVLSQQKLLQRLQDNSKLKSDYVQMAHHGQDGVDKNMYSIISPKVCLWPTPDWLWDCDIGNGKGSGPWKTLETRNWIQELNITKNYIAKDGDISIEIGG